MTKAGLEIERKFLVKGEFRHLAKENRHISQGYLSTEEGKTVRVRVADDKGFLTIKGKTNETGMSRFEWEKEIPLEEAERMLSMCSRLIEKVRYLVDVGEHTYEVDEFHGDNEGLVVAEIELSSEDESFVKPDWLDKEVTGDIRFFNSMLMRNPYNKWK